MRGTVADVRSRLADQLVTLLREAIADHQERVVAAAVQLASTRYPERDALASLPGPNPEEDAADHEIEAQQLATRLVSTEPAMTTDRGMSAVEERGR